MNESGFSELFTVCVCTWQLPGLIRLRVRVGFSSSELLLLAPRAPSQVAGQGLR